ncbi:hypothetical protein [Cellulomonas cellasea]|uniref:Uncharacterized protein n=1 Tax=Cellulomonas cellasea DSM 20118 TaxID=1408250 RepID=A0A0A0BBE5_9CELL|nr:hypothetical protein [Cellulomonas cellasea]KGM03417.1 hypothetical protein Q760_04065 [Cellulomonas cellasea DSM 20118]
MTTTTAAATRRPRGRCAWPLRVAAYDREQLVGGYTFVVTSR